jgi:hypothetical protein
VRHDITIIPEKGIALFDFQGDMSVNEGRQVFLEYVSCNNFDPKHVMMTDARKVTSVSATFAQVFAAVQTLREQLGNFDRGALSIVLVQNSNQFAYARMLEQILDFLSPITIRVAYNEEEALSLAARSERSLSELRQVPAASKVASVGHVEKKT